MSHCKPKHSVSCQVLLLTKSWWASSCLWIHEGGFSPWTRELWESPQVALSPEQTRCDQIKPHRGSKSLRVALTWWLKHLLHSLDHCAAGIKTSLYACLAHQPALLMMDVCQNVGWGLGQQRETAGVKQILNVWVIRPAHLCPAAAVGYQSHRRPGATNCRHAKRVPKVVLLFSPGLGLPLSETNTNWPQRAPKLIFPLRC